MLRRPARVAIIVTVRGAVDAAKLEGAARVDPFLTLGKLGTTILRELSTRYLHGEGDDVELALRLLQTYEGFHSQLRITDPADL